MIMIAVFMDDLISRCGVVKYPTCVQYIASLFGKLINSGKYQYFCVCVCALVVHVCPFCVYA
jgi:hypothetical protein